MNRMLHDRAVFKKKAEAGATLIELMIAMLILAVGLGALTTLFVGSMLTDNRNSKDTTATQLAQKVIEELAAYHGFGAAAGDQRQRSGLCRACNFAHGRRELRGDAENEAYGLQ